MPGAALMSQGKGAWRAAQRYRSGEWACAHALGTL
jgi:hypothetical protein